MTTEDADVRVEVDGVAAERIARDGGRLFVWTEAIGMGTRDCVSTRPPSSVRFTSHYLPRRNVEVFLEEDFPFENVKVSCPRWPFRGFKVYVDGMRWGQRGAMGGGIDFTTYGDKPRDQNR